MKIGVDLTPLQTGHRWRGIGSVIINSLNNLPQSAKKQHKFVFYRYQSDDDPIELIEIDDLDHELRLINRPGADQVIKKKRFRSRVQKLAASLTPLRKVVRVIRASLAIVELLLGDRRHFDVGDIDCFLQFDQSRSLPKMTGLKIVVAYDLIPYVLEAEYLWSYGTSRSKGLSVSQSVYRQLKRGQYWLQNKLVTRRADKIIAISKQTKTDFVTHLGVNSEKIEVVPLGINDSNNQAKTNNSNLQKDRLEINRYIDTSWGPAPRTVELGDKPYLLFVGGVDGRRRLVDLVAAYVNLKARGYDIQLVFAGDTMFGADEIPNESLRSYLSQSSYTSDVLFLGFVDDTERDWLYRHALAFVYPSLYEGFGLPVIEAMNYSCPVVCYKNSSLPEVGGDAALYADNWSGIRDHCIKMLDNPQLREQVVEHGQNQAKNFDWQQTASAIINLTVKSVANEND